MVLAASHADEGPARHLRAAAWPGAQPGMRIHSRQTRVTPGTAGFKVAGYEPAAACPLPPRLLDDRGYDRHRLAHDAGAGLTVGIVALPLAMAFAIASGLKPEAGLWTAIIGGLLVSDAGRQLGADRRPGRRLHRHRLRHRRAPRPGQPC